MTRAAITLVVVACAVWCLWTFRQEIARIDPAPLADRWPLLLAAGALSLGNYALRALRWHLYLQALGVRIAGRFSALSYMAGFAFTLSPGKVGELVRAHYYRPLGVGVGTVGSAFIAERVLDLAAMIVLCSIALSELAAYRGVLWTACALTLGLLALLATARTGAARPADTPPSRGHRLRERLLQPLVTARRLLTPRLLTIGGLLGLAAWAAEAWGLKLLCDALAPGRVDLLAAFGIYAIAVVAGAVSFLPGGLGGTEAVMAALLYQHGFDVPQALLLTLSCRLLTLWLAVALGWICVWILRGDRTVAPLPHPH